MVGLVKGRGRVEVEDELTNKIVARRTPLEEGW